MSIQYFNEDVTYRLLKKRKITSWIRSVIEYEGKNSGDISFIFCSDGYLLEMNKKYLKHFYYTDVITFDYGEEKLVSGDIFISLDRIRENSMEYGVSFDNELNRVLIHGVLHLLRYKDKDTKSKEMMTFKEDYYLKMLNDNLL
jgi:probable rRNA maturation factor